MVEPKANYSGSLSYYIFLTPLYFYQILPEDGESHKASFSHRSICCRIFLIMLTSLASEVSLYMCSVKPVFITSFSIRELVHLAFHLYKGYYQEVADSRKELNGM